jgi:hypothetical protein
MLRYRPAPERYPQPVVPTEAEVDGGDGGPGRQLVRFTTRRPGHIPAGPREPDHAEADWVRAIGQRRL